MTSSSDDIAELPSRYGPAPTTEANPRVIGPVRTSYAPDRDVHESGMRREACALGRARFDRVVQRLRVRYGWS
ncbi:hypothetical protein [Streptomyces flavidovirens]|uniref:hypothetical protein n=1 Tax=Streptomyces flavidovirens TaxID=67298 RepID=UPI0036C5CD49